MQKRISKTREALLFLLKKEANTFYLEWGDAFIYLAVSDQRPVVQSIVSLTSLLAVKMLIVVVSTSSNPQVILLKKCE